MDPNSRLFTISTEFHFARVHFVCKMYVYEGSGTLKFANAYEYLTNPLEFWCTQTDRTHIHPNCVGKSVWINIPISGYDVCCVPEQRNFLLPGSHFRGLEVWNIAWLCIANEEYFKDVRSIDLLDKP